jgi:alcohol dehydrogenase class IV
MKLCAMPEVVTGTDAVGALERRVREQALRRVFVVTGGHVSKTAAARQVLDAVSRAAEAVEVFDRTTADPTLELASEVCDLARAFRTDAVIGLGGGSPLDTAKIAAAALTNAGAVSSFLGIGQIRQRCAPLIAIPTTAGTGSEVTNVSVLTDTAAQLKKAVVSDAITPHAAYLIPELTLTMPPSVTAATGMDAFCHAAEAFVSVKRNPYSDAMALKALEMIGSVLLETQRSPDDLAAREQMQIAALLAGLSFNNSSVTAVHAFAYPLGGMFHVPHGLANSLMLEAVFAHGRAAMAGRYAAMAEVLTGKADADALVPYIHRLRERLGLPMSLSAYGIHEAAVPEMAHSVMSVTRLLSVNPVAITEADANKIYRQAYEGT